MEIKYQVIEDENLFIQKFIGQFSVEKYIKYSQYIMEYVMSKPIKRVLIDFRTLNFSDSTDNISEEHGGILSRMIELRKGLNNNELKNRDITLVICVDKPIPTAIAHLFITNISNKNYHYCSTEKKIITILELDEHLNLERIINNLENTFE